ncbi:MAG: ribokinase, partial [Lacrimispora sphenoides]
MKIGVVGSINMDMTVTAQRIPGKGETITGDAISYIPGGKGANQAVAAARLGADVTMFGCVGSDDHGKALIENLNNEGIHTEYIKVVENQVTGLAVITVAESDNCIIVLAGANNTVDIEYIDGIKEKLLTCDIVLLQQEILQETVEYVIGLCANHGVKVILNPAPAREIKRELVELVDYITPNEHEARIIFGDMADT